MNFIEKLPDEIILKIFKELKFKELGQCTQVCKKFRHISQDESLWQKINLYEKRVTPEFIAHILKQKTKYLNLFCAKIPKPCEELQSDYFPKKNQLKYLNLGFSTAQEEFLKYLTSTSSSLEKLSLAWLDLDWEFFEGLAQNSQTLKVLHLFDCNNLDQRNYSLDLKSIEIITSKFDQLTELNLGQTKLKRETIVYLCNNLSENLEKLSLENIKVTDEDIRTLLPRCCKLNEVDLNYTSITNRTVPIIIENLSKTLVKLSLPYEIDDLSKLMELKRMSKLKYLWLERYRVPSVKKDTLKKSLVGIEINEGGLRIAYPDQIFESKKGIWEIPCDQADI